MDKPLIYTSKGNVPEDTLRYEHKWTDNSEMTMFEEFWFDKESGELVKNNCHALGKKAFILGAEQAQMG